MITCKFAGGLGNNLFQFANIYNIHKIHNLPYFITKNFERLTFDGKRIQDEQRFSQAHDLEIPYFFDNTFVYLEDVNCDLSSLRQYTHPDMSSGNFRFVKPIVEDGIIYNGYFQSPKYFENSGLKHELILNTEIKNNLKQKYSGLFEKQTIAIHFRLAGDRKLKQIQQHHPMLPVSFYKSGLELLSFKTKKSLQDFNIVVFSDDVKEAANLMNQNFDINFTMANNKSNIEDFIHMSLCNHNIIANSTFAWWSAYLNYNDNLVVAPKTNFFGPALRHLDLSDFFPPEWLTL